MRNWLISLVSEGFDSYVFDYSLDGVNPFAGTVFYCYTSGVSNSEPRRAAPSLAMSL